MGDVTLIILPIVLALASLLIAPSLVLAQAGDAGAGKAVYERKCAGCHGDKGDGKGAAAELLMEPPQKPIQEMLDMEDA